MIIMGIDPGFGRTGWGIINNNKNNPELLGFGCIETKPNSLHEERIAMIYKEVVGLIKKYKPEAIALEDLFFGTNVTTAMGVGQSRGVIMLAAYQKCVPLTFYKPIEVKMAISGSGAADKSQVQKMVKMILKMTTIPKPDDAADALAIALTHCYSSKIKSYL